MSTLSAKQLSKTRHEQLAEAERVIQQASRDTVESIRIIGRELTKIKEESLFEVSGRDDFKDYVENRLPWLGFNLAQAWMRASTTLEVLAEEKLQLPYNQTQVLELAKLKTTESLIRTWRQILDFSAKKKEPITHDLVRSAVTAARAQTDEPVITRARTPKPKEKKGIDIDLGEVAGNGEQAPARTSAWSEEGEKALNRIRRLCGDITADAVDNGNPKVPEKDLLKWAEQEADMVKSVAYYIVNKRWTVKKALAYEADAITLETTVEELADLARSRGGQAHAALDDIRIKVEIVS